MDWRDEGVILGTRVHGENAVIVEVFTAQHGRHAGIVRGGTSRKMTPILQPGNHVSVEWRARLEEHLGSYVVDLIKTRSSILADRGRLAALGSFAALATYALPERQNLARFYMATTDLLDHIESSDAWAAYYAIWELELLDELGFGLDLSSCAATGSTEDLIYVSPKSGRAVSEAAGAPFADRMLALPEFFMGGPHPMLSEVKAGLTTTGFFLSKHLAGQLVGKPLPVARDRLIAALSRMSEM